MFILSAPSRSRCHVLIAYSFCNITTSFFSLSLLLSNIFFAIEFSQGRNSMNISSVVVVRRLSNSKESPLKLKCHFLASSRALDINQKRKERERERCGGRKSGEFRQPFAHGKWRYGREEKKAQKCDLFLHSFDNYWPDVQLIVIVFWVTLDIYRNKFYFRHLNINFILVFFSLSLFFIIACVNVWMNYIFPSLSIFPLSNQSRWGQEPECVWEWNYDREKIIRERKFQLF